MQRILILNAKGGCGKTTIATSLAGYYAQAGQVTALLDYDPQGSSIKWLNMRSGKHPAIQGIAAFQRRQGVTRAFQMQLPVNVKYAVVDAPSGVYGLQLIDYVQAADVIIVPVLPSPVDIHAAAHFIQELLLTAKVRNRGKRLGIVANRVRKNTVVFEDLKRFLNTLNIPIAATLRDSQNHMRAAEQGLSIYELQGGRMEPDRRCWEHLIKWLETEPDQLSAGVEPGRSHL